MRRVALAMALVAAPASAQVALVGAAEQGGLVRGIAPVGTVAVALDGRAVPMAADRAFVLGFDRDAAAAATLAFMRADGVRTTQAIAVAPRAWRLERVDAPYRAGRTTAEFDATRPGELARIEAARRVVTDAQGWRQAFRWPATGRISGLFGAQRVYQGKPGSYHGGTDVALPTGAPVVAPADGVVILAAERPFTLEGNLLMIDHRMGVSSAFLHLSRIAVTVGQPVRQGEPIGAVGATGRATGPHLHWGLRWGDARLDPMLVAGPMPGAGPRGE